MIKREPKRTRPTQAQLIAMRSASIEEYIKEHGFTVPVPDPVNSPSHYVSGGIETIDAIEAWGLGFCLGNAVKYISRAGKKDPLKRDEDLKKARWYLDRAIEKGGS